MSAADDLLALVHLSLDVLVFTEKEEAELGEAAVVEFVEGAVEKSADLVVESGAGHCLEVLGRLRLMSIVWHTRGESASPQPS